MTEGALVRRLGACLLVLALGSLAACEGLAAGTSERSTSSRVKQRDGHGQRSERAADRPGSSKARRTRDAHQDRGPREVRRPGTALVTHVVDGDTLELASGADVRLVGIDTPELGECGYEKAADHLARLVLGKRVVLTRPVEDRDRYGRLLRYVDVGGLDAGLRLIENGLAVARYDSRDGYGFHPREPRYVAADRGAPGLPCAQPRGFAAPAAGAACAPGYSPCVPAFPPDVDCAAVNGPVRVTGTDPHGLDGDGDGTACE